jgi:hypothetical protein
MERHGLDAGLLDEWACLDDLSRGQGADVVRLLLILLALLAAAPADAAIGIVGQRAMRYRYARLYIDEAKKHDGTAATYCGVANFTLWDRAVGHLPTSAMTSDSLPAPFAASSSSNYSGFAANMAFRGYRNLTGYGWLANDATGWVELDMGIPRDIIAFSIGCYYAHPSTSLSINATKFRLVLHNGVVAAGRVAFDNSAGEKITWSTSHWSRADVLAYAAKGIIGHWNTFQNGAYFTCEHRMAPRYGFLRLDAYPQSGTELTFDHAELYNGSGWVEGALPDSYTETHGFPKYVESGTVETQGAGKIWAPDPTTGWRVVGATNPESAYIVWPNDSVVPRGIALTCPASSYTRAPGTFSLHYWNGNGWTQLGSGTPAAWTSSRQRQEFTW